jgi:AAA+ ATPase superfamily predicted ATPase
MTSPRTDFVNRDWELEALERRWRAIESGPPGQILTVWGRRRVGKSRLLLQFGRDRRMLYYEATSGLASDQLRDFSELLARVTGRALFAEQPLSNWRAAFEAVAEWAERDQVLLVLDEFQFIARQSPDVGSHLNIWWRERGEALPIMIVLSGSEVGFFEQEVVGYSATTYGRRAGQVRLQPFSPAQAALFITSWSADDKVGAWAVFGGMPYYLAQIEPSRSLADNILELILTPDGLLHEEAILLLQQELPDADSYFSVLRAIAAGMTRQNQIAQRTGISPARVNQMLGLLQRLWLVRRETPVTVRDPARARQSSYIITDPYLRFWFTFVLPARDRLHDPAGARRHLRGRVLPALDDFISAPAFEEVCQAWLQRELDAAVTGRWWGKVRELRGKALRDIDREVDAVALDDDGRVLALGSCKWTAGALPYREKKKLDALAAHLVSDAEPPTLFFFARSGFDARLEQEAAEAGRVRLVTPPDLYG